MTPLSVPRNSVQQDAPASVQQVQGQIQAVAGRLKLLHQTRERLTERLDAVPAGERSILRQQLQEVDEQIADVNGELSGLVGRLVQAKVSDAFSNSLVPPRAPRAPQFPGASSDAITVSSILVTLGIMIPVSLALGRRLWRRAAPAPAPRAAEPVSTERFDRLEQAVDAIAIEIERISENPRFVTRVLTERPTSVRPAASPAEAKESSLGEGTPFLALGAGPVEAIPIAQRQGVKQSITPH